MFGIKLKNNVISPKQKGYNIEIDESDFIDSGGITKHQYIVG